MGPTSAAAATHRAADADLFGLLRDVIRIVDGAEDLGDALHATLVALRSRLGARDAVAHVLERGQLVERGADGDEVLDLDRAALLGRSVDERRVRWDADANPFRVSVPILSGSRVRGVLEVIDPARSPAPADVYALRDVGTVVGFAFERHDQRAVGLALEEAEATLVARAAHELRGMVATLGVAVTTLLARADRLSPSQRDDLASTIDEALRRLRHDMDRLVDMAELDRGERPLRPEVVAIGDVVRALLARHPATDREVVVEDDAVATALVDRAALEEILLVLLAHALERGTGDVRFAVRPRHHVVVVTVASAAAEVSPREAATLFQPFGPRMRTGFRLDLALARRLALALGGDLAHRPDTPCGPALVLTLPADATVVP